MTKRTPPGRRTQRLGQGLALAVGLAASGCVLDPGGPDYPRLGVTVVDADGSTRFTDCFTLPVLLGSRVDDEWPIAEAVDAYLSATRDEVTVRFVTSGQLLSEPVTLSADTLRRDHDEELVLTVPGTGELRVLLSSSCRDDDEASSP